MNKTRKTTNSTLHIPHSTLTRYALIDLTILAFVMVALEGLIFYGMNRFPGELYTLSIILPVSLIVIMRWGAVGVLYAVLGGWMHFLLLDVVDINRYLYVLGYLGVVLCLPLIFLPGKERVRDSTVLTVLFVVLGWLGMGIGRGFVVFQTLTAEVLAMDLLNGFAAVIIVLIARKQNGVFEDQRHYLNRLHEESKNGSTK